MCVCVGSLGYQPPGSPLESPGITMTLQHFLSVSESTVEEEDDDAMEDDNTAGDSMVSSLPYIS